MTVINVNDNLAGLTARIESGQHKSQVGFTTLFFFVGNVPENE